ncbi:hypothetical protein [Rheinheimera hassiensis]|uniref:hypothetical protein n=1 Tax=Rheinheimera hassiensis TaxID=1193627 RepID=UPI001F06F0CE|nr:hypothetical protein [Rheinheimera hassiensis]
MSEFVAITAWLKVNSFKLFTPHDLVDETKCNSTFFDTLNLLCSPAPGQDLASAAVTISNYLDGMVKVESWKKIKQRYHRNKHRQAKGAATIEVPDKTKLKLLQLKEEHGLDTMNDVICELLSGSISPQSKVASISPAINESVWRDQTAVVAEAVNSMPEDTQEHFVAFVAEVFADGYLQSKASKRRSIEDMQARIRQLKIFKLLHSKLMM